MFFVGCFPLRRHRLSGRGTAPSARWPIFGDLIYARWPFFGEIRVSRHAKSNMHNARSGPPVGCGGGRGRPRQASHIVVRRVRWPVSSSSTVVAPSSLFARVRGRPISRSVLPFSRRWVPLVPVRSWSWELRSWGSGTRSTPGRVGPWKARCTRRSREFIGDSSPAATVEGARRSFQARCKAISVLRPPGSSCGPQARRGRSCAGSWSLGAPCKRPPLGGPYP